MPRILVNRNKYGGATGLQVTYKCPHAPQGTPPRLHHTREKVLRDRKWSIRWGRGGTIDRRMFA